MREKSTWARVILGGLVLVITFSLAACSSGSKAKSTPTTTPVPTGLFSSVLPTMTPVPTEAPVRLEGATTLADGLQYLELVAGDGPAPEKGNIIRMDFVATLADGTELANTKTQGTPATVVWGRNLLLPGWEEAIGLMKQGGSAKIVLPPDLAFGAQGSGNVPANAQIIMEITLLSVMEAPVPETVAAEKLTRTATGLQYYDITIGSGTEAISKTIVSTDFTIWVQGVVSGTEKTDDMFIASSADSGAPTMFTLGRGDTVFAGWEQGVYGMKVGGKRLLIIPPDLAYGAQGYAEIPANAILVMEIILTDVHQPQVATPVNESDYTTTASGLKVYDLEVGQGETPQQGQTVTVHYTGWLSDGSQFDSSVDRNTPLSFVIGSGQVIPGMDEGVAGMKPGGKRQLVIPPDLGYGDSGSGNVIPPGATLIFEVELLEVK